MMMIREMKMKMKKKSMQFKTMSICKTGKVSNSEDFANWALNTGSKKNVMHWIYAWYIHTKYYIILYIQKRKKKLVKKESLDFRYKYYLNNCTKRSNCNI